MSVQNNTNVQNNLFMLVEGSKGATEDQASRSNAARDLMEAFNPMNILNAGAEMLMQVLGGLSG
jgi:hypothetical protein